MKNKKRIEEFKLLINDLINESSVKSMKNVSQHANVDCLKHSIYVSYVSFLICRFFKLDHYSAARGGLLHDLFLYKRNKRLWSHLVTHPEKALKNASKICDLNEIEKDIIIKHMWPVTLKMPAYKESFVVNCADKFCAITEVLYLYRLLKIEKKLNFAF